MQEQVVRIVDRVVADVRQRSLLPGGVVGVVAPGAGAGPWSTVIPFGAADLAADTPVDVGTVFEIGSLSKLFTALLLADVAMDPAVDIDLRTPLQTLAPVRIPRSGPNPITLADLVTHRAGLPRMPGNVTNSPAGRARYSAGELWSALGHSRLLYPPGEGFLYSNFGFGILGTVLAQVRNRPFAELVADIVCRPLGLDRTGIEPTLTPGPTRLAWWRHQGEVQDDGLTRGFATPYDASSAPGRPVVAERWDNIGALAGSGGLVSTGADLLRFLAAALGSSAGPAGPLFTMIRQIVPAADPARVGMGMAWEVRRAKLPGRLLFKNGGTAGMHCAMAIRVTGPYAGTGVVMLTNGPDDVDGPVRRILAAVGRMVVPDVGGP